ncbi:MAG: NHLP bacteriocin system secretion protein [Potamolinea sp.]
MAEQKSLFRQESLERLSSPERLDQLMKVVSSKDWLPLAALGSLVGLAFLWSILGRIPITVSGQGVLIYPRQVVPIQSNSSGRIQELNVKVGDNLKKGDIIATVDLIETQKQLQQQKDKMQELQAQNQGVNSLQNQRVDLELSTIEQQRQSLQERLRNTEILTPILQARVTTSIQQLRKTILERIDNTKALTPILRDTNRAAIAAERESLNSQLINAEETKKVLLKRLEVRKSLFNRPETDSQGNPILDNNGNQVRIAVISEDLVLQAQQDYLDNEAKMANLRTRRTELDSKQTEAEKSYRDNLNNVSALQAQLRELDGKETEAERYYRDNLNSISEIKAQLRNLDSKIPTLKQQNLESSTTRQNQIQEVKRTIAQLEVQLQGNSKITSPYNGRVLELTANPGQVFSPGLRLASIEAEENSENLVAVTYFPVQDGKKIEQKMKDLKGKNQQVELQITPTTVKRERYGGIKATVNTVSTFPISKEGATVSLGNLELVESLVSKGSHLEVIAQLKPDSSTFSGYSWSSSKGPQMKMSSGTPTTVKATVAEVPPITFVLPFLRGFFGLS